MAIDGKIWDENVQYDIKREAAKNQYYHLVNLINMNTLQVKKSCLFIKDKYSTLGKAFEKETNAIEEQRRKQIDCITNKSQ